MLEIETTPLGNLQWILEWERALRLRYARETVDFACFYIQLLDDEYPLLRAWVLDFKTTPPKTTKNKVEKEATIAISTSDGGLDIHRICFDWKYVFIFSQRRSPWRLPIDTELPAGGGLEAE